MNLQDSSNKIVFRPLEEEDGRWLKNLYDRTPDLEEIFAGVGEADAQSTYIALPENKTYDDKYLVGMWLDTALVGVADVIMAFPQPDRATCGLLLIDTQQRREGLGSNLLQHVEDTARREGAAILTVIVQSRNRKGIAFLGARGYLGQPSSERDSTVRCNKDLNA